MPPSQQEAIRSCFNNSQFKNKKSRRYTTAWIYDCLLIRTKSSSTYNYLRRVNLLPMPCSSTLNKYIKNISGSYGFQSNLFKLLEQKSKLLAPDERRGKIF